MPIHPLSDKGAFESPVNNISRLAGRDILFQKINGINILSFFLGGHSRSLRGDDLGFWGRQAGEVGSTLRAPVHVSCRPLLPWQLSCVFP